MTANEPGPSSARAEETHAAVTLWLEQAAAGDQAAWERVASWAYGELELLATRRMRREFGGRAVTLEPAALVNETFIKLLQANASLANRRHFFSFVSTIMLRVLIDYQRARRAGKRKHECVELTLDGLVGSGAPLPIDAMALDQALCKLERLHERKAEVAKLRALWGLTMHEIADVLGVSEPTVRRDWRFARSWLADALEL